MVRLQLIDFLELYLKRAEFLPGSRYLSRRDMTLTVESDVKNHFLLHPLLAFSSYLMTLQLCVM